MKKVYRKKLFLFKPYRKTFLFQDVMKKKENNFLKILHVFPPLKVFLYKKKSSNQISCVCNNW